MKTQFAFIFFVAMAIAGCSKPPILTDGDETIDFSDFENIKMDSCGNIGLISHHVLHGSGYFYDLSSKKIISICGGACMIVEVQNSESMPISKRKWRCENQCPPKEWLLCKQNS